MKTMKYILLAIFAAALLAASGCDSNSEKGTGSSSSPSASVSRQEAVSPGDAASSSSPSEKSREAKKWNIAVYYPDDQGMKLIAVKRTVQVETGDKYTAAMQSLMQGTKEKGQTAIIPKQAKLKGVTVKGDTAYVDFSQDLVRHFSGGSTGEEMLVGSVVNTLTEFSEIKKVQILIEGKPVESLAGHMDLTVPLTRMDGLIK